MRSLCVKHILKALLLHKLCLHFKVVGKVFKEAMCYTAKGQGRTIDVASGALR